MDELNSNKFHKLHLDEATMEELCLAFGVDSSDVEDYLNGVMNDVASVVDVWIRDSISHSLPKQVSSQLMLIATAYQASLVLAGLLICNGIYTPEEADRSALIVKLQSSISETFVRTIRNEMI